MGHCAGLDHDVTKIGYDSIIIALADDLGDTFRDWPRS